LGFVLPDLPEVGAVGVFEGAFEVGEEGCVGDVVWPERSIFVPAGSSATPS
jgi:hypothetical protein